jgi:hypothetical protein
MPILFHDLASGTPHVDVLSFATALRSAFDDGNFPTPYCQLVR